MKRILTIQDLSCMGKCSLTVALPVLSAMGCACTVLPTAMLSTHTAFPAPHCRDLTEDLLPVAQHWSSVGAEFDGISVGYLSDPEQAEQVQKVLALFSGTVVLDPAMGDHGKLYSKLTSAHVQAMKQLCRKADYLLPNVTEAALLTGLPYREQTDIPYLQELSDGLLELGAKGVVITGFLWEQDVTGFYCRERSGAEVEYRAKRIPKSLHGTGDMFSAVFTGALTGGKSAEEAARLAAGFVEQVVTATDAASPFGAEFESQLPWLWQQL